MKTCRSGFTLIEAIVVMTVAATLFGLLTINLIGAKPKASLQTSITTIVSDIKQQQIRAMTGSTSSGTNTDFGIFVQSNRYTLFSGSLYIPTSETNYIVNLDDNIEFSNINLPSSTIVFSRESGEVANFSLLSNTLTIKNTIDQSEKTLTINRFGVVESVN